jgi:hypothetical protein
MGVGITRVLHTSSSHQLDNHKHNEPVRKACAIAPVETGRIRLDRPRRCRGVCNCLTAVAVPFPGPKGQALLARDSEDKPKGKKPRGGSAAGCEWARTLTNESITFWY